jgi:sulfite reductase beta subunit
MQINSDESTKIAIWVGGKHSNARSKPAFHKLVAANLPNNAPRWPEVSEVVKRILTAYKEDGRDFERVGEWIERVGWPRFFELTDLAFTRHMIDDYRSGRDTLNASAHVHF